MADEATVAESMADLAKSSGIKNYLWLYFIIVPLAASTASAIAIIIAALQGLGDHADASQLYAKTLIVGVKIVGSIAAAYATGLLLALLGSFIGARRTGYLEDDQRRTQIELRRYRLANPRSSHSDEVYGDLGEMQFLLGFEMQKQARRQQMLVAMAVSYSAIALVVSAMFFIREDVAELWRLINQISAFGDAGSAASIKNMMSSQSIGQGLTQSTATP